MSRPKIVAASSLDMMKLTLTVQLMILKAQALRQDKAIFLNRQDLIIFHNLITSRNFKVLHVLNPSTVCSKSWPGLLFQHLC
jgi:hypothetical protein